MITSVAVPGTTPAGLGELKRTWSPIGDPWGTVVLVHGLGEHSGRYERTGSILAERGLDVRSYDLIGHGATGGRRAHVDDWTEFLDQLQAHLEEARGLERPLALLGHSLGGAISLDYVLSARPGPDALAVSAPALAGGKAWQRALAPRMAAILPKLTVPNGFTADQLSSDPEVGEAYFADPLVTTKSTAKLGAELFAAMNRILASIDSLDLPTLVVHGGSDTMVPPQSSLPLQARAERVLYPKLRHELFNEPEGPRVVGEVADWLQAALTA